ncbi:MAG TPA: pyridoxamine 5'-phosphate oxidase family protein [Tepidisphaeraceae bacterium]|jgi:hypothetical protein|nr:pyridoxamine 5'-phosphate oxidase family protein [Tepidisphaeraceae bacterium]
MATVYDTITPDLAAWIGQQRIFFVATAPSAADGHVNCSPKGLDSLRVLGPRSIAYLDLTGSGIETVAHLRENGRIVLMFCAFQGPPKIVRVHGRGTVLFPGDAAFADLRPRFPDVAGVRCLIHVDVTRISRSCGFGVPIFDGVEDRDQLPRYFAVNGEAGLAAYRMKKNAASIDGLLGLPGVGD